MGIYSGNNSMFSNGSDVITGDFNSLLEDTDIEVSESEDLIEIGFEAIGTMNENYNMIMQTIGTSELAALEETGEEMVYTEGVLSNLYNAIKSFILKVWEKIKGLFRRFMMIIDSYTKKDKDFLNKYRKRILAVTNLNDFEFKGYKFVTDTAAVNRGLENCKIEFMKSDRSDLDLDQADTSNTTWKSTADTTGADKAIERQDDYLEKVRASILNAITKKSHGTLTMEEFKKELKEFLHGGQTEKEDLDKEYYQPVRVVANLDGSKDIKKTAEDNFKTAKKVVNDDIKTLDRKHNEWMKDQPKETNTAHEKNQNENLGKAYGYYIKEAHARKDCMMAINSIFLECLKEYSRQNKAIAIKLVSHSPKKEDAYTESYSGSYSGDSFLANIQLK